MDIQQLKRTIERLNENSELKYNNYLKQFGANNNLTVYMEGTVSAFKTILKLIDSK